VSGEVTLSLYCALHCVDRARILDERAVAHELDQPPAMFRDLRLEQCGADGCQPR